MGGWFYVLKKLFNVIAAVCSISGWTKIHVCSLCVDRLDEMESMFNGYWEIIEVWALVIWIWEDKDLLVLAFFLVQYSPMKLYVCWFLRLVPL